VREQTGLAAAAAAGSKVTGPGRGDESSLQASGGEALAGVNLTRARIGGAAGGVEEAAAAAPRRNNLFSPTTRVIYFLPSISPPLPSPRHNFAVN
jgi:hypothetical protein